MKTFCGLGCAVLLLVLADVSAGGDEKIKTAARTAMAEYSDAVISVKYAGFVTYLVNEKEVKQDFKGEATGTVLSPNGLTASCLSSIKLAQDAAVGAPDTMTRTALTEFTLLFGDGRKMPGRLVARDEKLGVLYVAPMEKQTKLRYLGLEKRKTLEVLDQLIVLNRLRENLDREVEIGIGRVSAVLKKAQPALVTDVGSEGGCPVFDSGGRPVGLGVLRVEKNAGDVAGFSGNSPRFIVLPAEALNIGKHLETVKGWHKDDK